MAAKNIQDSFISVIVILCLIIILVCCLSSVFKQLRNRSENSNQNDQNVESRQTFDQEELHEKPVLDSPNPNIKAPDFEAIIPLPVPPPNYDDVRNQSIKMTINENSTLMERKIKYDREVKSTSGYTSLTRLKRLFKSKSLTKNNSITRNSTIPDQSSIHQTSIQNCEYVKSTTQTLPSQNKMSTPSVKK